jgi:hypothetical protein
MERPINDITFLVVSKAETPSGAEVGFGAGAGVLGVSTGAGVTPAGAVPWEVPFTAQASRNSFATWVNRQEEANL